MESQVGADAQQRVDIGAAGRSPLPAGRVPLQWPLARRPSALQQAGRPQACAPPHPTLPQLHAAPTCVRFARLVHMHDGRSHVRANMQAHLRAHARAIAHTHTRAPHTHAHTRTHARTGKYTQGLGQQELGFCGDREDVISMAATAMLRLMEVYDVSPHDVGR